MATLKIELTAKDLYVILLALEEAIRYNKNIKRQISYDNLFQKQLDKDIAANKEMIEKLTAIKAK